MSRLLHAINIPEDALTDPRAAQQSQLATAGVLDSPSGTVEDIAAEPGTQALIGALAGRFAQLTAAELEELFSSDLTVPYTVRDGDDPQIDGYYATEQVEIRRGAAEADRLQRFDGSLTLKGTREDYRRAVRTNPQTVDNPFGSASTPEIGLTIRADSVQWFDDVGGGLEDATAQRRVEGAHDALDIYDASEPSFDSPILVYDLDYREEFPTDCTVWDSFNRSKIYRDPGSSPQVGTATVGSSTVGGDRARAVQWQRVYAEDHEFVGDIVLETDRLRLTVTQDADLRAYRWSPAEGQWTLVQLGTSDWRLADIDLTDIGLANIDAQLTFEDQSTGTREAIDVALLRGLEDAVFTTPDNVTSTSQGLIDRLSPIADDSDRVVAPTQAVVKRTETNR